MKVSDHNCRKKFVVGQGATVLPGNRILIVGGEGHYDNKSSYKYPKHVNEVFFAAWTPQES